MPRRRGRKIISKDVIHINSLGKLQTEEQAKRKETTGKETGQHAYKRVKAGT
jgi:hypothetical protein